MTRLMSMQTNPARRGRRVLGSLLAAALFASPAAADTSARDLYTRALARERSLRDAATSSTLQDFRGAMREYDLIVRRYPKSGYSDNALWQIAGLALLTFERFHENADRRAGERALKALRSEYPSSSLVARVGQRLDAFEQTARAWAAAQAAQRARAADAARVAAGPVAVPSEGRARTGVATIRQISRQPLPKGARVVIELDAEVAYREERLADPPRVFFDLKGVEAAPLDLEPLGRGDDVIRQIRLGQHPENTTRVVVELAAEPRYTVFALYDPYRLVVDFERVPSSGAAGVAPATAPGSGAPDAVPAVARPITASPAGPLAVDAPPPLTIPAPAAPSANSTGKFSLARQLGLGIARVVIDPGHGGHDPGAKSVGVTEAETVLDIALRLEKLLLEQPGIEVVMTRRTNVFVPLEERTAIANREGADLFLSIHANASRNRAANGVETYFLNFASNPEAEAVAARENSASGGSMHNLPDIVRAIALNNKLEESKDLARMVQDAMIGRLKPEHKTVRNLGVKQAPFVVLIGAQMPGVLAEVSFITNRTEAALLKKDSYRQRVAQALTDAVLTYQKTLKANAVIAQ